MVGAAEPKVAPKSGRRRSATSCICECGRSVVVGNSDLSSGKTQSCGCLNREVTAARSITHGHGRVGKHTSEYITWGNMIARVSDPSRAGWNRYGGRGITVCERWKSYESFFADMGEKPEPKKDWSIDRIDNNGHYCPENCRWATKQEQNVNRGYVHQITFYGKTRPIREWSKITQVPVKTISNRIGLGWPARFACWAPVGSRIKALKERYPHHVPATGVQ